MTKGNLAILISFSSMAVAALSLGWNIYRDLILKAKLKVTFAVSWIQHETFREPLERLVLSATNFGPGKIRCETLQLRNAPFWRWLLRKTELGFLIYDNIDLLGGNLPCELQIGQRTSFLLKFDGKCFLSEDFTHIGISDSFGRIHWAPKKHIVEAKKIYQNKFGKTKS